MTAPSFSIVICTDGRRRALERTLRSLDRLDYENFEVCVVCGPTPDGTREFAVGFGHGVKVEYCSERNLSMSRNIGISISRGDIVAFLDDDAMPESAWLRDLAEAYGDSSVGAAGGLVYNHTGVEYQTKYVTIDRLGYPHTRWAGPAPHLNFPFSSQFPHLLGANCSFRRSVLLELGGFDEEYEYFLDETDMCCRVNDAGYRIAQLPRALVHHAFAPSAVRDERRVVSRWYPQLKNRIYFILKNSRLHYSAEEAVGAGQRDAAAWETNVRAGVRDGIQAPADLNRFLSEAEAAMRDGAVAGLRRGRRTQSQAKLQAPDAPFQRFAPTLDLSHRLTVCLVTQDYPPGQNGGIARNMAELAQTLADAGHEIHVLTRNRGLASVEFEDGVWVHRLDIAHHPLPTPSIIAPRIIPQHIWDYSKTMLEAAKAIDAQRHVAAVYCPLWDCEPIAFVGEPLFPVICALQTTMRFWLESQPEKGADREWMTEFGDPIIAMEEYIIARADLLHANSHAIVEDIEARYGLRMAPERLFHSPHCLPDWAAQAEPARSPSWKDTVRLLFVGRLESRKGIDVLLQSFPALARKFPNARLDIVGDDTIPRADGATYKSEFLSTIAGDDRLLERVTFHGRVEEDALRAFYRDCDIFVAPSRYESFGLVYLEAMIFGKPVIGGAAGGGREVIADKRTGLLVPPGDAGALRGAMETLVASADLRREMGQAGRDMFLSKFNLSVMRRDFETAIRELNQRIQVTTETRLALR